jgi:hypothetical protein
MEEHQEAGLVLLHDMSRMSTWRSPQDHPVASMTWRSRGKNQAKPQNVCTSIEILTFGNISNGHAKTSLSIRQVTMCAQALLVCCNGRGSLYPSNLICFQCQTLPRLQKCTTSVHCSCMPRIAQCNPSAPRRFCYIFVELFLWVDIKSF